MSHPLKVLLVEDSPLDQTRIIEQIRLAGVPFTHLALDGVQGLPEQLQRADWDEVITAYNQPAAQVLGLQRGRTHPQSLRAVHAVSPAAAPSGFPLPASPAKPPGRC